MNKIADVFEDCRKINDLIESKEESAAREKVIQLLDKLSKESKGIPNILNHLIRKVGLYPYIDKTSASWDDRLVSNLFQVDVGNDEPVTLHRAQSFLLKKLLSGKNIAVSAPTSFGKSFVVDAFIKAKKPEIVVIIVPTIALTDETRRRLYKKFSDEYAIITTTDCKMEKKSILIFPQERIFSYLSQLKMVDLFVVDEFYKASITHDKERSPALINAILKIGKIAKQKYYLAPNIDELIENPFTKDMEFIRIDFKTVFLNLIDSYKSIKQGLQTKNDCLLDVINLNKKTLIYAGTYSNIDAITMLLLENVKANGKQKTIDFSNWISTNYSPNWALTNLVKRGIGVHNGQLHRSISQIQVRLFEDPDGLDSIISTSSIIEGVNTSAENVVLWVYKNGKSPLNDFTYRNICGRGGRMFRHFIGNIFLLDEPKSKKDDSRQLSLELPDSLIGSIDEKEFSTELSKDQIRKIIEYRNEISSILGDEAFKEIQRNELLQTNDSELIRRIVIDMSTNITSWNGLACLNSPDVDNWTNLLYKVINLKPGGWDAKYSDFVEFVKLTSQNWQLKIPELLDLLAEYNIGLNEFFKLERNLANKLAPLLNDINVIAQYLPMNRKVDISSFISKVSTSFLPRSVYLLEEYGLPRMISKKIHLAGLINLEDRDYQFNELIEKFRNIHADTIYSKVKELTDFDKYIIDFFYEGITKKSPNKRCS